MKTKTVPLHIDAKVAQKSVSLREDSVHRYEEAALAKSQSLF